MSTAPTPPSVPATEPSAHLALADKLYDIAYSRFVGVENTEEAQEAAAIACIARHLDDSFHSATSALANERRENLEAFWSEQSAWSQATFGTDAERGPIGALKHLAKEAVEAQAMPPDLMEFVDCLFLTFDATRRAGFTFDQLREAAWRKLAVNKARKWPKPGASDEPVEHDRSGEAQLAAPRQHGDGGAT